jgi:hypothetical protein
MINERIHSRGFTSLISLATFLVMALTGLILYFVPQGRVAYWVDWKFLGLTKTDWGNIHIINSLVFATAAGFHLYFNWKPLKNYLIGKISGALRFRKELAMTSVLAFLIFFGSIYQFPPFNYVIDFSGYLKGRWVVSKEYEPPFGHAEEVSLKIFSKRLDIDLGKAEEELRSQGVKFDSSNETLKDIASANNIVPMDIYVLIKKYEKKIAKDGSVVFTPDRVDEKFAGTGIGRKELFWVLEDIGMDKKIAKERLYRNNIVLEKDETLKDAGERYNIDPMEILKVTLIEGYSPVKEEI